jgi:hypothetical protein
MRLRATGSEAPGYGQQNTRSLGVIFALPLLLHGNNWPPATITGFRLAKVAPLAIDLPEGLRGDNLSCIMLQPHSIRAASRQVGLADEPLRQREAASSRTLPAPVPEVAAHGEVAVGCNDRCKP